MHWYHHRLSSAGNRHILNTLLACHLTGCHIHALLHGNICLSITCSCSKPDVNILSFIIGLRTLLSINANRMEYWRIFRISTDYCILLLTPVRFTHSVMWQGEYWKLDIATGFMDEVLDLPVALRSWSTRCIDWGLNLATGCIGTIIGCLPRVTHIFWTRYLPAIWQAAIFTRYSTAIFVCPLHVLVANQTLISCRLLSVCVLY